MTGWVRARECSKRKTLLNLEDSIHVRKLLQFAAIHENKAWGYCLSPTIHVSSSPFCFVFTIRRTFSPGGTYVSRF